MKKLVFLFGLSLLFISCQSESYSKQNKKRFQQLESIKGKYTVVGNNCYYFPEEGAELAKTLKTFLEAHNGLSIEKMFSSKNGKGVFIIFYFNEQYTAKG